MKPIWWLPTFGFFLFLAIEFGMFYEPSRLFEDPGVGRHLRTAEYILETGQIPRTDPLSFTKEGQPWIDFEWAFEATIGELYRVGGLGLVCAFCNALFALTILGIYRTLLHSGLPLIAVLLTTSIAFLTLHIHFSIRPVLFTYLLMALVVEVWRRQIVPRRRDWVLLPLIFVAWANLHAGWLGALVFLGLAVGGRLLDRITKRINGDEGPVLPWIGLILLCFLATFVNPWGWELHRSVLFLATSLKSASLWVEYLPPDFKTPSMSAVAVIYIVAIVLLARILRRAPFWCWADAIPALFFLYEGMKAQRHVLLLMEIVAVPVTRDLQILLRGNWFSFLRERLEAFQEKQQFAGGDAWLAFVAVLGMTWLFLHTPIAHNIRVGSSVTPQLASFLRDHRDRFYRPLTTTWNAGPLLWHMRPDFRVSFDDRGDFYGDETVYSFVDLTRAAPGWQQKLASGNYDSLILDPYLDLNKQLHTLPEWKLVYRDEHAMVYWRDN